MRDEAAAALRRLNELIEQLRAPGGCPWDREQTHASLKPFLLEETYEVLEAIDHDAAHLKEELGDVLLQVLMHSAIAAERRDLPGDLEGFDIGDVAEAITAKMIHRHPHVFGDKIVGGAADVVVNWERLKAQEKQAPESLLQGVPRSLPALAFAQAVQRRPARLGFEAVAGGDGATGEVDGVLTNLRERLAAIGAVGGDPDRERGWTATDGGFARDGAVVGGDPLHNSDSTVEAAVGELLFAVVGLARRVGVDAEDALRRRSSAFSERFSEVEAAARADGVDIHELTPEQWQQRWQAAP